MKADTTRQGSFRSLLVPLDLTPNSDRVLGRVPLLPLAADARITLLHVVPGGLPAPAQKDAERDAYKALAGEARHLRKTLPKNVSVQSLVEFGAAVKGISVRAQRVKAELIVMGRGGGRVLRDTFLGPTAERVVRQARLPVLMVRQPPRRAYGRPVLALDFDRAAPEVVRLTLLTIPPPRPRITVVHAYDFPYGGLVYPSLAEDEAAGEKSELQALAAEKLAKLLSTTVNKLGGSRDTIPAWKMHVRYGSPHVVVERVIRRADTDLLVLGTRGYSRATHVFLGTVAGDLLRDAKCDVLVVPPAATRGHEAASVKHQAG